MKKSFLGTALLVTFLSAPAVLAAEREQRNDGWTPSRVFARIVSKIVHALDDIRIGPPTP